MNKNIFGAFIFSLVLIVASDAHSGEMVVGLSPFNQSAKAENQTKSFINYLLENSNPGDKVRFYDAYNLRSLGVFEIPTNPGYRHPRAKLMVNKEVIKALLEFAEKAREPKEEEGEPSVAGAMRWPQFLRFIGENLSHSEETEVVLLGNPLYDDPKEPDYSMANDNRVPADSQLLAQKRRTPFGTKGDSELLSNIRVHLGFPNINWKSNNQNSFLVKRLWALFIEKQGGQLITFTGDLPTLLDRLKNHADAPKHDYKFNIAPKNEIALGDEKPKEFSKNDIQPAVPEKQVSIFDRALSEETVSINDAKQANFVEIGITWKGSIDLDIYCRPTSQSETLYFSHKNSKEGKYIQDFMSSPGSSNYETVVFDTPIDLNQLLIAVNFYNGTVNKPISGEIRISINNQIYAQKFEIKGKKGNSAAGRDSTLSNKKPANSNWLVIDPLQVVGIKNKDVL